LGRERNSLPAVAAGVGKAGEQRNGGGISQHKLRVPLYTQDKGVPRQGHGLYQAVLASGLQAKGGGQHFCPLVVAAVDRQGVHLQQGVE